MIDSGRRDDEPDAVGMEPLVDDLEVEVGDAVADRLNFVVGETPDVVRAIRRVRSESHHVEALRVGVEANAAGQCASGLSLPLGGVPEMIAVGGATAQQICNAAQAGEMLSGRILRALSQHQLDILCVELLLQFAMGTLGLCEPLVFAVDLLAEGTAARFGDRLG